ncbi:hypothetical protein ACFYSC_14055 [Streptosporangium sp. NPDC004379]|uniref:hypothetical protein n=1 Tax=Streptosporangium sp. NPDC004379 TaxID=3366189 RepID=UPI0036B219A9
MRIAEGAHHCGLPCRWCGGGGTWSPERPSVRRSGEIVFVRAEEECRMCLGTGECMHTHPGDSPETPI